MTAGEVATDATNICGEICSALAASPTPPVERWKYDYWEVFAAGAGARAGAARVAVNLDAVSDSSALRRDEGPR